MDTSKVYRIRTSVGNDAPNVIQVPLNQTYDMFEILSLKLNQTNTYKTYESSYGVIVGRVIANGGFGIENARVSVFIPVSDDDSLKDKLLYNFTSVNGRDDKGIRYNLLPDYVDDACHQNVGTFPNKRLVLDNDDVIEMFDKYWKYTTRTNHSGDYMLFGIPTGSVQIHCDVDLSDCGILSQRPRDMINKGYNATMFESPNKFKSSTNLNSLAQIVSQDRGVYVYPYWGDISDGDDKFGITRCDINIEYKFESYAVFIGSIVTDKGSNAIGKNCTGTTNNGKMSDLIAGEGTIEMIRKTLDGKVEEFPIMGNRLIDGDGVWCYAIPMNLDYVTTDEFGNLVPTDNPDKGIATRSRVRFRISLDENPNDATARKRAKYLVPNNPRMGEGEFDETLEADYDFGSATREESYCDMFWNKVYTVKNYIPKLQKNNKETNRKHTGIKLINHYGDNNPMPYNALTIKLSFTYRLICVIVKIFILLIGFLNNLISILGYLPCWLGTKCLKISKWKICPFKKLLELIPGCIELSSDFCDDGINPNVYYPGCGKPFDCVWTKKTRKECQDAQRKLPKEEQKICSDSSAQLYTCVENELAQQNDATSFNFNNDWVNGVLYAPLWYRKITPKKRYFFGLFKRKAKDEWCSADRNFEGLRLIQGCAVVREKSENTYENFEHNKDIRPYYVKDGGCGDKCQKSLSVVKGMNGLIRNKETMLGQTVYYYKSVEYDKNLKKNDYANTNKNGEIKILFATDIVLLGSLNECDINGIPQFFKTLESTTYNMPTDILFSDYEIENIFDTNGNFVESEYTVSSEMAGCDWGNKNEYGKYDGGLFYDIGCSTIHLMTKSCINLSRLCEYGVSLDETKQVPKLSDLRDDGDGAFENLITDGFVSFDELYNLDERSMFATMNGNKLRTKLNVKNGLQEYDFRYLYPHNFDGSLEKTMKDTTKSYNSNVTYRNNYKLEQLSNDYYIFRMGNAPYYYDNDKKFPRYENSFYFYFGLKAGKTAIEKFNSKYFAECDNTNSVQSQIGVKTLANGWCSKNDGYVAFDFSNISVPYDMLINGITNNDITYDIKNINFDKIIIYDTDENVSQFEDYERLKNGDEFVKMLDNGNYKGVVTDSNGNITEFTFSIVGKYLSFKTEIQDFKQPNNVLGTDYIAICKRAEGLEHNDETKQVTRGIGGVISICDINMNNNDINYRVRIEPQKTIEGYEFVEFTKSNPTGLGVHKYTTNGDVYYGIFVPKGGISYNIIINEICNGVDVKNIVTRTVFVSEPMPYKMFINDVDYDLIKNFNKINGTEEYSSGWKPNGKISNKRADLQNNSRNITFTNNPWFNINNVWADSTFKNISSIQTIEEEITETNITTFINSIYDGTYQFNTDIEGVKVTLNKLLNEFTKISVGGNPKVYYTWNGDYIVNDYHSDSFKPTVDKYNLENINDLVNDLNRFVDEVNDVIILRNNLPSLMQEAFYITCSNEQKNINIRVQTSDMPGIATLVYQQETTVEDDDENTLTSDNMVISYDGNIDNINIPTITYACNEKYGIKDSITYEPVVAEIVKSNKKYRKHAYYVGTMNNATNSIPSGLNKHENNKIWQIDENNNNLSDLFDFPIIDKVLKINYISWAYMDKMPYFKKYVDGNLIKETVTMNGVFAANVFNGNVSLNNEFNTQSLCDLTLKLSNNLVNNQQTYVEKRIVLGYKDDDSLQSLRGLYSFTKYYVDTNVVDDKTQYAPVLPLQTTLHLENENGCGISETIFGNMSIELTDESVNNCLTKEKKLEVVAINADNGDVIYYSVINVENFTYPLNYANNEQSLSKIDNEVEGLYGLNNEYNIFSYKMTSDYFREGDNKIVDTSFKSQIGEIQDDGSVKYVDKYGYGTTGKFTGTINKPIYIVAETTNHCRALSPVYDYSDVVAKVKYGTLERGEVKEHGTIEITKDYRFGILIDNNDTQQFYLKNYEYRLSGTCKLDSVNIIEVSEETLSAPNQYIFTTITETLYNMLKSKYNLNINSKQIAFLFKTFKNNTEIIAYDYTGLKHICNIKNLPSETAWYSYIWNANVPEGVENIGIKVGENNISLYEEDYYEERTPLSGVTIYDDDKIKDNDEYKWLGWSENKPLADGGRRIDNWSSIIGSNGVNKCRVFYGNWKKTSTVRFFDTDETTQIGDTMIVENNTKVTPPSGYRTKIWYVKGDKTKARVSFSTYKIEKDTDFILYT